MTVTTRFGHPIEALGRAIGGRAVLRLKNASGVNRDLVELATRHDKLSAEVTPLRALIEAHAVAGLGARRRRPIDLRQFRLCARRRRQKRRRRHGQSRRIPRQRGARRHRAIAHERLGLCGPAARRRRRHAPHIRRARHHHRERLDRHRRRRDRSRSDAGGARSSRSTRIAARSTSCRPASPCSAPITG